MLVNMKGVLADAAKGGYAIGGLAVGEPTEVMYEIIEAVRLSLNTPRRMRSTVRSTSPRR